MEAKGGYGSCGEKNSLHKAGPETLHRIITRYKLFLDPYTIDGIPF